MTKLTKILKNFTNLKIPMETRGEMLYNKIGTNNARPSGRRYRHIFERS